MSSVYYSQFWSSLWGFKVDRLQRLSRSIAGVVWGSILAILLVISLVLILGKDGGRDSHGWAWIDVVRVILLKVVIRSPVQVYTFGYIKLLVTVIKYMPQVWMNYKRQSTDGWSIGQILLDFSGGVLSLLQLSIDASFQPDWSGVIGNPVKLGLGNVSIFFDLIFITQHYLLYRHAAARKAGEAIEDVDEPLLANE